MQTLKFRLSLVPVRFGSTSEETRSCSNRAWFRRFATAAVAGGVLLLTRASMLAQLPSMVDPSFNPVLELQVGGTNLAPSVSAVYVEPSGRILVAGAFTAVNGVARPSMARLNADGTLDMSFLPPPITNSDPYAYSSPIWDIARQSSGKLIIRGSFTNVAEAARPGLARLNLDGSLDTNFAPTVPPAGNFLNFAIQADDKVMLYPTRLNANGTVDTNYIPPFLTRPDSFFAPGTVYQVALQSSGKLLVGGDFRVEYYVGPTYVDTTSLIRLNSDGSIDGSFPPVFSPAQSAYVQSIAVQKNNDAIYISGGFFYIGGVPRATSARLNANGALDTSWVPAGEIANSIIYWGPAQQNGKVFAGSSRFNNNGSLDTGFNLEVEGDFYGYGYASANPAALQADGRVLVIGAFTAVGYTPRTSLARLYGGEPIPFAPIIRVQPTNQAAAELASASFTTSVESFPLASYQWQREGTNVVGATQSSLTLHNLELSDAGTYRLIASNSVGSVTSAPALLQVIARGGRPDPGALEPGFFALLENTPVYDIAVSVIVPQNDGRILIAGDFSSVWSVNRPGLARLNHDGSLDPAFAPGTGANGDITSMLLQSDGKVVIGGYFSTVAGVGRNQIARLNADGSLDTTFASPIPANSNAVVRSMLLQGDGKIFLTASRNDDPEGSYSGFAWRLNGDGTRDFSFAPAANCRRVAAIRADGRLISLALNTNNYASRLAQLNSNGSVDGSFVFTNDLFAYANYLSLGLQSDGKLLVFDYYGDPPLIRLNTDGSLDAGFHGVASNYYGYPTIQFAVEGSGRILAAESWSGLERLNPDGQIDPTWPFVQSYGTALALETNGNILVGGYFTSWDGAERFGIARLLGDSVSANFVAQPTNQLILTGSNAVFRVSVTTAKPPLTYRWRFNGVDIAGATNATLTISNAQLADVGSYFVMVRDGGGAVASYPVSLVLSDAPAPTVTTLPAGAVAADRATFYGTANPNSRSTWAYFEYGPTTSYGSVTPIVDVGSGISVIALTNITVSLSPLTTYHFRLVAGSSQGTNYGADLAFMTPALPLAGWASRFEMTGDFMVVSNAGLELPTNEITIEFWLRAEPKGLIIGDNNYYPFQLSELNYTRSVEGVIPIYLDYNPNNVSWLFGPSGGGDRLGYVPSMSVTGAWHHFAMVSSRAGNFRRIYQDGLLAAEEPSAQSFLPYDAVLNIGNGRYGSASELDEFRIWSVARAQPEIQQTMYTPLSGAESNLWAYWRFDEGPGSGPAMDASGHGRNGPFFGGAFRVASGAPLTGPALPVIVSQPADQIVLSGATATFSVSATTANPPLRYQWQLNGGNISGETNATLTITNVQVASAGDYRAVVSDSVAAIASAPALLNLLNASPLVVTLAASGIGTNAATLAGTVTPNGVATTAWFEYGLTTNYGGNTASLRLGSGGSNIAMNALIAGLGPEKIYHFRLVASNRGRTNYGLDQTFRTLSVNEGLAAGLGAAVDAPDLIWSFGGSPGWFTDTATTHDGIDAAGSSSMCNYGQQDWIQTTVTGPGTLTFWWAVSIPGIPPISYGNDLAFAIDSVFQPGSIHGTVGWQQQTFTLGAGSHVLTWMHTDSDDFCGVAAWVDQVVFTPLIAITVQPTNQLVFIGSNATFAVSATSTNGPVRYQWQFNGTNIPDATNQSLTITNAQVANSGEYQVVLTVDAGSLTSTVATLSLIDVAAPSVTTLEPSGVSFNGATLRGTVDPHGGPTDVYFDYGSTTAYGSQTPHVVLSGANPTTVEILATGVMPGAVCHYRIVAANNGGTNVGEDFNFTTQGKLATSIAADTFGYPGGAANGLSGGIGFSGPYAGGGIISAGGLNYTDTNGAEMPGSGNRFTTQSTLPNFRPLQTNSQPAGVLDTSGKFGADGAVIYIAFLARLETGTSSSYGGLSLYNDSAEQVFIGDGGLGEVTWGLGLYNNGSLYSYPSTVPITGTTRLLVTRINFAAGNESISLYVDPPLASEPAVATVGPIVKTDFRFNRIRLASGSAGTHSFGELRIGTTYADVVKAVPTIIITKQPINQLVFAGANASLSVSASSTKPPLSYQWRYNGTDIAGATNATLTISNAQANQAGNYDVVLRDATSVLNSSLANLELFFPYITIQPTNMAVRFSSNATFTVIASGAPPLRYQWQFNGTNLPLATNATLLITNAQSTHFGNYAVMVNNDFGAVTSAVVALQYFQPPVVLQQPQSMTVVAGESATFTVTITNNATLPILYQWRKLSVVLTNIVLNSTTCSFTLYNVQTNVTTTNGPGAYRAFVSNSVSAGVSSTFGTLTVVTATPPAVVTGSASNLLSVGATLNGTVNPKGATTSARFEYGLSAIYGNSTPAIPVGNGTNALLVSRAVSGLAAATTYHFRIVASNGGGTNSGADQTFTTSGLPPAPTLPRPVWQGNQLSLSVATVAGATYYLERKSSLSDSNWTVVATMAGDGSAHSLIDPAGTGPQGFYRVRVE